MIIEGNFRLTGLKQNDITPEIDNLINSAKEFIVICGYGFTNHNNPKSILGKVLRSPIKSKHCILPISLYRGKDANRMRVIHMIQNGVSVSIEDKNHSKWIMNEKEIYYGSANFTMDSLERKIEVATFRNFIELDPVKKEFLEFIHQSMNRMITTSNRQRIRGFIRANHTLISSARSLIKPLNPSIEKVIQTVDSINEVRSFIHEVLENSFWYLDDNRYIEMTIAAWKLEQDVRSINFRGAELLDLNLLSKNSEHEADLFSNDREFQAKVLWYNRACDVFQRNTKMFDGIMQNVLGMPSKSPSFSLLNRRLVRKQLNQFGQ